MSFVIRGKGSVQDTAEIGAIFIKSVDGTPVYLRDIAAVGLDYPPPTGIFSKDRHDESIEGIVLMRRGENPSEVLGRVKEAVEELNATLLPKGVQVKTFYDRTFLVENTLHTVAHSVLLGITLVVLVLLLFLGRPSMAALVALTIPFALLVALAADVRHGDPHRPALGGGDRLRHHRRRRGDHGREHRPPPGRRRPRADRARTSTRWCWPPPWRSSGRSSSRC